MKLGLGGAPLGNMYEAVSDEQARAVLEAAFADGCRTFDTAPHYGNGRSEQRFGDFIRRIDREAIVLSTKVGRLLEPDPNAPRNFGAYVDVLPNRQRFDYSASGVRRSFEDSLRRLRVGRVDIAYVHDCSAMTHGDNAPAVLRQVLEQALPELARLKRERCIGKVGVAVSDWRVCVEILRQADLDCLLLAGRYTLLDQTGFAELLPLCQKRRVRLAIGGVFNSGILATGVANAAAPLRFNYEEAPPAMVARARKVEALCAEFDVPLRAAALQFPLAHPCVDVVLVGVKTLAHWRDAIAKLQHPIPKAFWGALRSAELIAEGVPTP